MNEKIFFFPLFPWIYLDCELHKYMDINQIKILFPTIGTSSESKFLPSLW